MKDRLEFYGVMLGVMALAITIILLFRASWLT
jgi:hypothetical protein